MSFVEHINLPYYPSNTKFCDVIYPLVKTILDSSTSGKIGYQKSNNRSYANNRSNSNYFRDIKQIKLAKTKREIYNDSNDVDFDNSPNELTSIKELGPLEKNFLNCILNPYQVLVLTGGIGSGKTELIKYISNHLCTCKTHKMCKNFENCKIKEDYHIVIDFNQYDGSGHDDFSNFLFYKLLKLIRKIFNDTAVIDKFIEWCDNGEEEYFIDISLHINKIDKWDTFNSKTKIIEICSWIKNCFEKNNNFESGVKAILEMLKFYHKSCPRQYTSCFMLIFDNVDGLDEKQQVIIIDKINRIAATFRDIHFCKQKIIVTSRITTFNHHIKGKGAFSFEVFQNFGCQPLSILLLRLEYYIKNKGKDDDYITLRRNIPEDMLNAFDGRLEYIYSKLFDEQRGFDRLRNTINSLSGLNIRGAFSIFRRLFSNHIIPWHATSPREDMLIRSLYSFDFEDGKMKSDDKRLSNLYINPSTLKHSLLPLRLLNLLNDCQKKTIFISKHEVLLHLSLFDNNYRNNVEDVIEYLIMERKRLVNIVGNGTSDIDIFEKGPAKIDITYAGSQYFEYLSSDLQYVQSCFEIIDWDFNIDNIMIDESLKYIKLLNIKDDSNYFLNTYINDIKNNNIQNILPSRVSNNNQNERIEFIQLCLKLLFLKDIIETSVYRKKRREIPLDKIKNLQPIQEMVIAKIIAIISNSVLKIYRNYEFTPLIKGYILNWYNFILIVEEWNRVLFPDSEINFYDVIENYENFLGLRNS